MTVLVLNCDLLPAALDALGEEELLIAVDPSAERLEQLLERYPDPRISFLIGDGVVIPLPDRAVDEVLGEGSEAEIRRVLRA